MAKKVLKKAEQRHLTEDAGINSMAAMERQIEFMKKEEPNDPARICSVCWHIAQKLGVV